MEPKQLSALSDGLNGMWVFFHEKTPPEVPPWDKIQIVFEKIGDNPQRREHWIHEEEALSLISGLAQGIVEIQTRKPIRRWVTRTLNGGDTR
jgi:hypothetical protein